MYVNMMQHHIWYFLFLNFNLFCNFNIKSVQICWRSHMSMTGLSKLLCKGHKPMFFVVLSTCEQINQSNICVLCIKQVLISLLLCWDGGNWNSMWERNLIPGVEDRKLFQLYGAYKIFFDHSSLRSFKWDYPYGYPPKKYCGGRLEDFLYPPPNQEISPPPIFQVHHTTRCIWFLFIPPF